MNMHAMNMQLTVVVWGGLDFAYHLAGAARRPLIMTTSTRVWTLNPLSQIRTLPGGWIGLDGEQIIKTYSATAMGHFT